MKERFAREQQCVLTLSLLPDFANIPITVQLFIYRLSRIFVETYRTQQIRKKTHEPLSRQGDSPSYHIRPGSSFDEFLCVRWVTAAVPPPRGIRRLLQSEGGHRLRDENPPT